jgi:hypothetical protein
VSSGPTTHFTVSAPATATAGTAFNFTVTALDVFNNVAASYAGFVHFTSTDGSAILPTDSTVTSGIGTFSATLKTAGNQTITGRDSVNSSITGTSAAVVVTQAPIPTPAPPAFLMGITGLAFVGLYFARRNLA